MEEYETKGDDSSCYQRVDLGGGLIRKLHEVLHQLAAQVWWWGNVSHPGSPLKGTCEVVLFMPECRS
ncbi:hypothetical protein D3C76_1200400 [compost metagenome]